ncbi:zinc finger protein 736-like [Belonocnema kinseyi]|uniref:zinc finger protein 736-like n=1 Tax=Belonocnema kinseyi TaxID=2817044 RepID=UPI00143DBCA3|nr:zinc finger protein 736-like [Belonocnema kinseyi]
MEGGRDLPTKSEPKKLTGILVDGLIDYENDETLEIKEEIIQDQETTGENRNEKYESKFCTIYMKEDNIFSAENKLQSQMKEKFPDTKHKPEMKYKCEKCARGYKTKSSLYNHKLLDCNIVPQYSCGFCSKSFKRKSNMSRHVGAVHLKTNSQTPQTSYNCSKCSQSYNWLNGLYRHKRMEHAAVTQTFFCDSCNYTTNRKRNLSRHITSRHLQTSKLRHKCDKCSRSYKWLKDLYRHTRLEHSEGKPPQFNCDICDYQTKRKRDLSLHITAVHPNK